MNIYKVNDIGELIRDNSNNLKLAEKLKLDYILIDEKYEINF